MLWCRRKQRWPLAGASLTSWGGSESEAKSPHPLEPSKTVGLEISLTKCLLTFPPLGPLLTNNTLCAPHRLMVLTLVSRSREKMLLEMLDVCSLKWEARQQASLILSGKRQYPAQLRHQHIFTKPVLAALGSCCVAGGRSTLSALWGLVPHPEVAIRHLSFKLVSRMAIGVLEMLLLDEFEHPLPLLCLDLQQQPREAAARFFDTDAVPPCLLDRWSAGMLERFPSPEALLSEPAAAERQLILLGGQMCIGRIESRHSSVRRLVKMGSLQSSSTNIMDVSGNFYPQ